MADYCLGRVVEAFTAEGGLYGLHVASSRDLMAEFDFQKASDLFVSQKAVPEINEGTVWADVWHQDVKMRCLASISTGLRVSDDVGFFEGEAVFISNGPQGPNGLVRCQVLVRRDYELCYGVLDAPRFGPEFRLFQDEVGFPEDDANALVGVVVHVRDDPGRTAGFNSV